jgi:hypothetical protein
MDRAKEKATLSTMLICRKKTKDQVKPGKKKTNIKANIALMIGKLSRNGETNRKSSLMGNSQSTL